MAMEGDLDIVAKVETSNVMQRFKLFRLLDDCLSPNRTKSNNQTL